MRASEYPSPKQTVTAVLPTFCRHTHVSDLCPELTNFKLVSTPIEKKFVLQLNIVMCVLLYVA